MLDLFGSFQSLLRLERISTDNLVFRLHYKVTVILLLVFSLLVTSRQYFGDPISCIGDYTVQSVMDTYCWIHSTYTVIDTMDGEVGAIVPYPGISGASGDSSEVKYHKYYQWVCFLLFFQAMVFYVPRYLWKMWEGGRLRLLVTDLTCPILPEDFKGHSKNLVLNYFMANLSNHNSYAWRFFFCEVLNFLNVLLQIFLTNVFLGYEFTTYGSQVLSFTEADPFRRVDPMAKVFPKVTKCTFKKYGPSGNIVPHDGLCVLPLNIINEKVYVFLWFWFLLLALVSGLSLVYRAATCLIPEMRVQLLRSKGRLADAGAVRQIAGKSSIGSWFLLYQMGRNMDAMVFRELIQDLAERLQVKEEEGFVNSDTLPAKPL